MGSDSAPSLSDIFLYYYEKIWVLATKKDLQKAPLSRFIDDLRAINDQPEFDKTYKDTYPTELELLKKV